MLDLREGREDEKADYWAGIRYFGHYRKYANYIRVLTRCLMEAPGTIYTMLVLPTSARKSCLNGWTVGEIDHKIMHDLYSHGSLLSLHMAVYTVV